jgi:hypothetical protein
MLQSLFYLTTALHVSGIIITHLQEPKTTVITASGNRYDYQMLKMGDNDSRNKLKQLSDKINSVTCASCWDFYIRCV